VTRRSQIIHSYAREHGGLRYVKRKRSRRQEKAEEARIRFHVERATRDPTIYTLKPPPSKPDSLATLQRLEMTRQYFIFSALSQRCQKATRPSQIIHFPA
jgi:hypothetical protein